MKTGLSVGLIQMCASERVPENIESASTLIEEARNKGADFILTPEMTGIFEQRKKNLFENTHFEETDPALAAFKALASDLKVWLLIGSLAIKVGDDKLVNRSFLISPGGIRARYDKIHMFDVDLEDGESYRESSTYKAGKKPVVTTTPFGTLGLSICYDLRFPYLYRRLAHMGARIIAVPSSFTKVTGAAHWHTLLRARAIETGCFVLAPAQAGRHSNGRETFGHTLVVDPWGEVLLDAGTVDQGAFVVSLDLTKIEKARTMIPALKHDKKLST
ncbi:MAG: carbon-nitrogen hydrolase family protein [Sphingomonadales bacterium]